MKYICQYIYIGDLSDEELKLLIHNALSNKKEVLGGHTSLASLAATSNRPMILIGGWLM